MGRKIIHLLCWLPFKESVKCLVVWWVALQLNQSKVYWGTTFQRIQSFFFANGNLGAFPCHGQINSLSFRLRNSIESCGNCVHLIRAVLCHTAKFVGRTVSSLCRHHTGPYAGFWLGGVLYQAEEDFSGPSTNRYMYMHTHQWRIMRWGDAHFNKIAQNVLLGGSGGMPPQENFGF